MPYLVEILLFLLPFAAYALWRQMNPTAEPSAALLAAAACGVALMLATAIWYGLSRGEDRRMDYVAPRWDGTVEAIEPGHPEPRHAEPRR